jgi:hypothetical protein
LGNLFKKPKFIMIIEIKYFYLSAMPRQLGACVALPLGVPCSPAQRFDAVSRDIAT